MPPFNLDLIDPAPAVVENAMFEAVEKANLRCSVGLMRPDRAAYRGFLASDFTAPEGVALWVGDKGRGDTFPPTPRSTLLGVAWWTNPLGRRTVRIVGRRIEPFRESSSNRFGPPWHSWPALCHIDPDHVVTRTFTGGKPETIALCGCGAIGPPEKLGWMGGRCGPCHDHLEEHGVPLTASIGPPALRTVGQIREVGFLPSGRTVAAVEWMVASRGEGDRRVTVWDRLTGIPRPEANPGPGFMPGAVAWKPRTSADLATGLLLPGGHLLLLWIGEGERPPLYLPGPSDGNALAVEGTTAIALGYEGTGYRRDLTTEGNWNECWPSRRRRHEIYSALAFSPGGAKVALGRTDCVVDLLDWPGGSGPTLQPVVPQDEAEHMRVHALAFSPDGKLLASGFGTSGFVEDPSEDWSGRGGGIHLYDAVKGEFLTSFPTNNDDIIAVAFSPDGALLFCGSTDCTIRVIDVKKREEIASLSGHIGGVNALAFSPDGQTLASGGGDGLVRFWPWRQLLERPATKRKRKGK
jgi:WD40 repeat protein